MINKNILETFKMQFDNSNVTWHSQYPMNKPPSQPGRSPTSEAIFMLALLKISHF